MNKNAATQLHIYSAFFVLAGFVLNRGVFLLFLAEKGMSVTEIALYQALFNIATVVLELPTGLIGDFFGKKVSIQVGVLLLFFHTAGMLLLSGPFLVVLSLVEALAYSLQSGSEQALLYEIARNAGQGERFLTINARLLAAQSIATGMAIVLGSFIAQVSWSALYVCVSVFYLLQLFLLYPIERTEATRSKNSGEERFDVAKVFRRETWCIGESAFAVLLLLIGTSMLDGFYGSYYNLNQLVFDAFDAPVSIIGIFFGASYAVNATAYIAADFFSSRFGKRNTMLGSMLIEAGLFMILPWFASNPLCLFGLSMVLCFLPEVVYITSENLIQDAIADDLRATILSVASLVRALFSAMFFSIFGYVLGLYPIQIALGVIGAIAIAITAVVSLKMVGIHVSKN